MKWKDTQIQNKHFNRSVYLQTKEQMFFVYLLLDFGLAEVTPIFHHGRLQCYCFFASCMGTVT